jgi:voltage-gated potassium channel
VLLPFLKILRLAQVLRASRALPTFRLLVFGGRGSQSTLALLRRRRLGQLAIISAMVMLVGAALGFLLEAGAPGSPIEDFGDALWWSGALVTTIGSELYPVTAAGRILGFALMIYAIGIFTYFIGSVASVLVAFDASRTQKQGDKGGVELSEAEVEALRSILKKAEGS